MHAARGETGYVPGEMLCHYVTRPYDKCAEDDGYLVLKEGQVVFVEYIGCDGHEEGWLFGYKSGSENHHGWFPQWCIEKIPPVPPTTSRATPSPLRNVPSYALNGCDKERQRYMALDSFARAATPPPDDEEIFQRQITPPPDDDDDVCDSNPWLSPKEPSDPPPPAPKGLPISQLPPPGLDVHADAASFRSVTEGLEVGKDLPMYQYCAELKRKVTENRVVMVDAATGSGKSTLVPLCLAQQCLEEGRSCRIVVTQPRRMAAKKLAERVSKQVDRDVGTLIGYRVGGQDKRDHPQGLVVYVTVGHFLEALVHNPAHLENFSHVVLDEVHERFVEADFLMALLRMLLSRPESVKTRIVVMSATLQKALHLFFKPVLLPAPHRAEMTSITSPGSTPFKVEDFFLEDLPLHIRQKGPSFGELLPENLKTLKKSTTRSDKLTSACQKLTAVGAKWIKHLYEVMDIQVVLAFLPGLDQMKELKNHLTSMVEPAMQPTTEKPLKPDIILMHSALDDNDYKHAGDPVPPGQWKVIIATNMAESSLTLPSVGAVLDFGMHRVNEYNDESKMSTLVTSWCSKASLKQRRGRTGRTNDGKYYCMMERRVYEQLEDYDQSGVERSSLTKVALEAAYLADVLSREPQIRAGLPATVPARETVGRIVDFFDGDVGLWRIRAAEAQGECEWAAEEDLRLSQLHLDDVLKLLPSPPKTARIQTAITDLQEFGTLTVGERPTALGIACLKLPAEVHLARLVVLGWSMNMGPSACVLAAALSLTPSCDVFLTPMNTQGDLDGNSLYLLQQSISARSEYDGGWLSEPLTIYALCEKWLKNGGGLGQVPKIEEWRFVHQRLWSQFSAKVVDLWRAMQRLVPREDSRSYHDLRALQDLARGSPWGSFQPHRVEHLLEQDKEKLLALLTWGLAPGSFLAIGQSPSIYGKGSYGEFWKKAEKLDWDVADCLYWKRSQSDVEYTLNCLRNSNGTIRHVESAHIKEVTHEDVTDEKSKKACIVHLRKGQNDSRETKSEFELLYRLCSPFNGKATIGNLKIVSPVHPCALNWYMPYRNCEGLKEVCLNWKSPAYSLLNTTRRWPDRCRPKRFLVASGGDYRTDYHGDTKTRVTMLRGTSVLPSRDGGRQALLWCLAAGVPRDAQMTALCAPCKAPKAPKVPGAPEPPETPETPGNTLNPEHFEVRGLWMWERTLRLPNNAIITSADLKVVNDFRQALKKMQSYQPHRLAGTWYAEDAAFRIDYLEDEDEALDGEDGFAGRHDILIISKLFAHCEAGCEDVRKLYPCPGGWSLPTDGKTIRLEELSDGLRYEGRVLKRKEELAILEQFNPKSLKALKEAADKLLEVAKKAPQSRSPWPGRLVPLWADTAMSPFDLTDIEKRLANFCSDLRERSDLWGFQSQEEDNNNCDMEDDDVYIDTSLEKINKGYMWTLAESETFDLDNCGYLQMPENSIALPTAAVCVMCEEQGKTFSKRQLANPIHNRLCQDCILEKTAALQGNAYIKAEKSILRPPTAAQTMPKLVPAAAAQLPKVCSVCKKLLDAKNSTSTQRTKPTNKRKCQACAVKPT